MKRLVLQIVQLLAVAPVAVMSLAGLFLALMALSSAFSTGHFFGSLLIALALIAPGLMVLSLCIAIVVPPAQLRARDRLAGGVALGLVTGSVLAVVLIYMELNSWEPASWRALLMFAAPLALAVVHVVNIAKAKRLPAVAEPVPTPLE